MKWLTSCFSPLNCILLLSVFYHPVIYILSRILPTRIPVPCPRELLGNLYLPVLSYPAAVFLIVNAYPCNLRPPLRQRALSSGPPKNLCTSGHLRPRIEKDGQRGALRLRLGFPWNPDRGQCRGSGNDPQGSVHQVSPALR